MSKYSLTILVFLFPAKKAHTQGIFPEPRSAAIMGMADNGLNKQDANAIFYNPAGLVYLPHSSFSFQAIHYWNTAELNCWSTSFSSKPGSHDALGFQIFGLSSSIFNYSKTGVAYARTISKNSAVGIQFYHRGMYLKGDNPFSNHDLMLEAGLQIQLNPKLRLAALLAKTHLFQKDSEKKQLSDSYKLGCLIKPGRLIEMTLELKHALKTLPELSWGLNYTPPEGKMHWRMGINWSCKELTTGFGWEYPKLNWDISTLYHPELGFTYALGILFKLKHYAYTTP